MRVPTITFDLFPSEETFTIPLDEDTLYLVNSHPHTHNIRFGEAFDFQLNHFPTPPQFIQFGQAVLSSLDLCLNDSDYELASTNEDCMA